MLQQNLSISSLLKAYEKGETSPRKIVENLKKAMDEAPREIWITRTSDEQLEKYLAALENVSLSESGIPADKPLYGIPFAIKDNIDCEGMESTSACPAYAYMPEKSAFVVQLLIDAGAIPMGKTNMDQFATGLVGVRSPYGCIPNRYAPEYISGGSSSGSAASLAYGLCSFSLGTDTAGSGRIPAAFNKLVGVKPTCGLLSTSGVIPACRSLDCVSIFALNCDDARYVLNIAAAEDEKDDYSRRAPVQMNRLDEKWTFGVPSEEYLQFFGNNDYKAAFNRTVKAFEKAGGTKVVINFAPFLEAARMLYEGPWVFERFDAVGKFIEEHPNEIYPTTREIISPKKIPHPAEIFAGFHALKAKKKIADREFAKVDILLTPTAGTIYKTAEVLADPIRLNSNLGYYTNYMNLLDYSALAIPADSTSIGMHGDLCNLKLPFGVTLVGKAFDDYKLLDVAQKVAPYLNDKVTLAVCGAHLKGEPLHIQLQTADFLESATTATEYRMFAFEEDGISKPALVHTALFTKSSAVYGANLNADSAAVDCVGCGFYVELYALTPEEFGKFVAAIPAPLGIGKIKLSDGRMVSGFIGDSSIANLAASGLAKDISEYGDWRSYVHQK